MTNSVRILYTQNTADLYGASRALVRLLSEMQRRGVTPVVVMPEDGPLREFIENLKIEVIIDPWLTVIDRAMVRSPLKILRSVIGYPVSTWRLFRLIRKRGIQIVHTNTGVMPSSALAARLAGVPHVWHIRDNFQEFRSAWSAYRRYIVSMSRRVLCISQFVAGQFPGARNTVVVHDAVPLEEFPTALDDLRARFREKYQLGDMLVVGCVGRIKFVRKGQEVLVKAAAILKKRGVTAKYLIVGSPAAGNEDHLTRLKQLIHDSGVTEDVLLTGELADTRPAYAAMDVFVMPSVMPEPLGGVVLESMAMRCPAIATSIGGPLDMIQDGDSGFLVPPGDAEALANKLEKLLKDPSLRRQMGNAGRAALERDFTVGVMGNKLEAVYRQLLTDK